MVAHSCPSGCQHLPEVISVDDLSGYIWHLYRIFFFFLVEPKDNATENGFIPHPALRNIQKVSDQH